MKNLIFTFSIFLSIFVQAQEKYNETDIFIRVYNLQGQKVAKGKIMNVSDSILQLTSKRKIINVSFDKIGFIKTKRSIGNNILIGACIGASALAILGTSVGKTGSYVGGSNSDAVIGLFSGGFFGSIIGGITAFFKKSDTFIINGDKLKFKEFIGKTIVLK